MATSKTVEDETNTSSSPDTELDGNMLCSPCHGDGKKLEAIGYCNDCKEYLCETCFKYHRLPSLMRKHVLLDKKQMGSVAESGCQEHDNRAVEYHCPTHSLVGCNACFFQHQKTCKDSRYIPETAEDFPSSKEFKEFRAKLDYVATTIKGLIAKAKRNSGSVDKRSAENKTAIHAFKLQVIEAVEQLEKDLISKAEHLKETEATKWGDILKKCISFEESTTAISTELEVLQNKNQNAELYLAMVKFRDNLESLVDQTNAVDKDSELNLARYEGNTELLEALKSPWALGKLVDTGTISSVEHVTDINVKFGDDGFDCCIEGSTMMPGGKLVIVDYNNKKVKLADTRKSTVVSELKPSDNPWSVAKITDTTVAVTVPGNKKIMFVRTDPVLSVDRELVVNKTCHGVAYCRGKLLVTFYNDNKVDVMDLQGTVLREIATDGDGKALFASPYAVVTDPNNNVMYISNNSGEHNVKCLKLDGTVVATYKDSDGESLPSEILSCSMSTMILGFGVVDIIADTQLQINVEIDVVHSFVVGA